MRKSTAWLLPVLFVMTLLTACGQSGKLNGTGGSAGGEVTDPPPTISIAPTESPKPHRSIDVYYTDTELTDYLKRQIDVTYDNDQELLEQAIAALQQRGDNDVPSPWEKMEFKSVKLEDGVVTLDIHMPDEARSGSAGEVTALETLSRTLFQFDFVQSYNLLVDGSQVDSLMGHVELEYPTIRGAE
ncbi:GerMN domain-containing protein [Paenibacillus sp. NPDC058071]|uniref:GerMN domain-containing protein n=1 Tax=Paenibacillus sp. NPDC058071 TaxID=3346326 RepID=UPI0036D97ED5